jgi:hypothetical protein
MRLLRGDQADHRCDIYFLESRDGQISGTTNLLLTNEIPITVVCFARLFLPALAINEMNLDIWDDWGDVAYAAYGYMSISDSRCLVVSSTHIEVSIESGHYHL